MFNRQQPLGHQGLVNIIKEACQLADYKKHVTAHSFRHCYATRLIRNSKDIVGVSELLGHSQPSTTLNIYAHTNEERKRMIAEMSNMVSAPISPSVPAQTPVQADPLPPARDIAAPGQDKRLSRRKSIRLGR